MGIVLLNCMKVSFFKGLHIFAGIKMAAKNAVY